MSIAITGFPVNRSEKFNSNGTWTAPVGVNYVLVTGAGGGGGGGGDVGEGGSGAAITTRVVSVIPGTTYNITIGSGGAGGTVASPNGENGASSSFGSETWIGGVGGGATGTNVQEVSGSGAIGGNVGIFPFDGAPSAYASGGSSNDAGGGGGGIGAGGDSGSSSDGQDGGIAAGGGGGSSGQSGGDGGAGQIEVFWWSQKS